MSVCWLASTHRYRGSTEADTMSAMPRGMNPEETEVVKLPSAL